MNSGKFIFAQLTDVIHREQFARCVRRYNGEYKVKTFSCWSQFLCMAFGQLTFRDSLSDIEICLRSREEQLYHIGIRGRVSRSTLADANESRDWRIYADLAQGLIRRARRLYQNDPIAAEINETVYALDSTTIDLCLQLFPWARFRQTKAAIKLHTLLDFRGSIPTFMSISEGKQADVLLLDDLILEPGAFYVIDRGYVDFCRLHNFVDAHAFFVTRSKKGIQFTRIQSFPVDQSTGIRSDQIVRLKSPGSRDKYPEKLRKTRYFDSETQKNLVFLTNNFALDAITIALLYKGRWSVELFFKWIKQNLRIKHFFGNSANAVKTQIWISVCVYCLVAIIKRELGLDMRLSQIMQILSVNAFEKVPLHQLLTEITLQSTTNYDCNQLMLWD